MLAFFVSVYGEWSELHGRGVCHAAGAALLHR